MPYGRNGGRPGARGYGRVVPKVKASSSSGVKVVKSGTFTQNKA